MWHLSNKKHAMHTIIYGQRSARKKTIDWWLSLLGLIPITLTAIILSIVAMATITASFAVVTTGWYWFLAFIFVGAIIGQGASSGNPFSTTMSAIVTDGLFHHLKLYILKRELKKYHSMKIAALLKQHRENIQAQMQRKKEDNSAENEVDDYLKQLIKEQDDVMLHQLLMTYLNGKKDNKAKNTQALFDEPLQRAIDDIFEQKSIKRELLIKNLLLMTFGVLVTLTAIGYSTIIFTYIFGTLATFSFFAANTALVVTLAGGAAAVVALIFGFGLYHQFHQATMDNIFKHLFHVIKDIFDPRYIAITAKKWNKQSKSPSIIKEKSIMLGLSVFHGGKILTLLCVFGGLLTITALVSLFTAGASLNASISTMNFILLGLNLASPTALNVAQWLAAVNVGVIIITTTIFGYLSASEFIGHTALLIKKTIAGELNLKDRFSDRCLKYKKQPWLALGDAFIAALFTFVFTSYLAFELVKMAIPLEAARNPTTDAIPSYMAFSTFFSAVTQALNQLPHILGLENNHSFVNRSVSSVRETYHNVLANCRAQWEYWFGTRVFSKARLKVNHSTITLFEILRITPPNFTQQPPSIAENTIKNQGKTSSIFYNNPLYTINDKFTADAVKPLENPLYSFNQPANTPLNTS